MLWYTPDEVLKYKDSLQDGDIVLYHKVGNWFNSLGAKLIQFGTHGPFNHSDFVYHDGDDLRVIYADTFGGITDTLWKNVYEGTSNYMVVLRPTLMENGSKYTKQTGKEVIKNASNYIGDKYDFIALTVFFFKMLGFGIFNGWNPFNIPGHYFCSENVTKVERDTEILFCPGYTPASVSPNQIFIDMNSKLDIVYLEGDTNTERKELFKSKKPLIYSMLTNDIKKLY